MIDFVTAIGLVLVIEGVFYGGFPNFARRVAAEAASMPDQVLRFAGLFAIVAGVGIVWLAKG